MDKSTPGKRLSDKRKSFSFRVSRANSCPVYKTNDRFELNDTFLYAPAGKPTCIPLTSNLILHRKQIEENVKDGKYDTFSCEGCEQSNSIKVEHVISQETSEKIEHIVSLLQEFSFFKLLRKGDIRELVPELTVSNCQEGDIIISRGEPGKALYIIVSGKVEVLPDENEESITTHGVGKVFGEMSLLSGDLCTATVRVLEPTQLLTMKPERFKNMIYHFPKLQKYFFQLLARRLDKSNMASIHGGAEIQGNLSEWKLPDLLQTLNINNKCGRLELKMNESSATVHFCNGQICDVEYDTFSNIDGFFELFKLKEASFSFRPNTELENAQQSQPIGDFMFLMMEGMVRSDEHTHFSGAEMN